MRRILACMLALTLLTGASACSDDDKDATNTTAPAGTGDSAAPDDGGDSGTSSNDTVAAYCKAVDAYVDRIKEAGSGGLTSADMIKEGQELSKKAAALGTANLSAAELQEVADCTKKTTAALTGG